MKLLRNCRCTILIHLRLFFFVIGLSIEFGFGTSDRRCAAEPSSETLTTQLTESVQPFLARYCFDCHGSEKQEAKLNLKDDLSLAAVIRDYRAWDIVADRLVAREMPPQTSTSQPTVIERQFVIDWVQAVRESEAARNAGDPGPVLARRLSNAEFDYTIRDLTGVDIRPTKEFPVDPANESGFDNTGESLTMSPALLKKYLAAARHVADHVVLTPRGFEFAPHPAITETDRDKYCVQQIVSFYQRHEVDYADYFFAAWQYQHRELSGRSDATLSEFAEMYTDENRALTVHDAANGTSPVTRLTESQTRRPLSRKYLAEVWSVLSEPVSVGPLAELRAAWQKLPATSSRIDEIRDECVRLRDLVLKQRSELDAKVEKLHVKGQSDGSQPLILWWNRHIAAGRRGYAGTGLDPALDAERVRFCRVFPSAFAVSSRGLYADPKLGAKVRLLTAGFHLMHGYFRDDGPLCELVLVESEQAELDRLWQNLNFVTLAPIRQYKDFLFFERAEPPQFAGGAEFDFARPENKDVTSQATLTRMREAYVARARENQASEQALQAIEDYFENMLTDVAWIDSVRPTAESSHVESLVKFAEQAYRRPLEPLERREMIEFYHSLRTHEGLGHDEAIRDAISSILISPYFLYRCELTPTQTLDPSVGGVRPLTGYELASRLSYFLWSSMPDDELLSHAEQGDLTQHDVLLAQAHRMLRDARIRGLASEFAGNWLEIRRFEEHNSVDRDRFSGFTNELRAGMYEEPLHLFSEIVRQNRSILDFLDAKETFVNPVLASHYGIKLPERRNVMGSPGDSWYRVENANDYGRGGLLTMSVFLTKNSPGLRTSPVKRGYWVVRRLLGEHIPPPPPQVAELPKDEASLGELTLPQLLARHRNHQACAGCHQRFDSIGLAFEGYGPVGERRERDLGGRPVDDTAVFPDGTERTGVEGLRDYLLTVKKQDFIDNLSRKLLSYGLGRTLLLSDSSVLKQMRDRLSVDENRFVNLIDVIVSSRQFLTKRVDHNPQQE